MISLPTGWGQNTPRNCLPPSNVPRRGRSPTRRPAVRGEESGRPAEASILFSQRRYPRRPRELSRPVGSRDTTRCEIKRATPPARESRGGLQLAGPLSAWPSCRNPRAHHGGEAPPGDPSHILQFVRAPTVHDGGVVCGGYRGDRPGRLAQSRPTLNKTRRTVLARSIRHTPR